MGTTTKLTYAEYQQLPESGGARYELDEGTLVMLPSPTWWHNLIRDRIATRLREFSKAHKLGAVTVETEFRLSSETSRTPDVAFVTLKRFKNIDIHRSPVDGAPDLAVEVLSPGNPMEDTAKKIQQYLDGGCHAVWVIFPSLHRAEIHSTSGIRNVREPEALREEALLPGFSLPLSYIFGADEW